MSRKISVLFIVAVLACSALVAMGQTAADADLTKGKTLEKVLIAADTSQSYALYLPTAYDTSKKFPILFCFDPGGRGSVAVEKYQKAAEKYAYIVVGSNNSRNGLDGPGLTSIIRNLWTEANQRFSVDPNRESAAGLSGGARVASWLAVATSGGIFGVVGSGAGFSPEVVIDAKLPFIFFGTVGYDDFNYPELRELEKRLAALHIVRRIEAFDGGHQWLDESLAEEALAWLEIRAMKAGRRAKDDSMIETLFQARIARAEGYLAEKKYYEAYSAYLGVVDDFGGWRDVAKITEKIKAMESSPDLKQAVKSDAEQVRGQMKTTSELVALIEKLDDPDQRADARNQLHQEIAALTKQAAAAADSRDRRVARRSLSQISAQSVESALYRFERDGNFRAALVNLDVAAEINPKSSQIPFNRARIYALQGDKKKAIEALTKAVDLGLKDPNRLTNEKAFDTLQKDERFVKLLAALQR